MNKFIVYNTHLEAWDIYTLGSEKQDGYTACHHHQGQNRPHQKTITHSHTPPQPSQKYNKLLGGGEGVVHSPLPCGKSKRGTSRRASAPQLGHNVSVC